jgi:phospholipid/cholesterol/gamma-HCH transport system substrate-binding protein
MSRLKRAAQVGAVTVVLAVAGALVYRFGVRGAGTGGYRVHAYLPDVTGIAPRSRVTVSGIQVGVIDRLSLERGMARVDIEMLPEFVLYEDAAVGKRATSLIGETIIVLTRGTEGLARIPDEGEITHTLEDPTAESLGGQINDVVRDLKAVSRALDETVGSDRGKDQIARIVRNAAAVNAEIDEAVKENRAGAASAVRNADALTSDSRRQIAEILQNVRRLGDDIRTMTREPAAPGPAGKGTPGDELRSTVERLDRASANLERTLARAEVIAGGIARGEGTLGRLSKDDTLINEVESTVGEMREAVGGFGRIQAVIGLTLEYYFLAASPENTVEIRLQPAEDSYYSIEIVGDPRGKTNIQQIDVDTTNPNSPAHYRNIITTTTNSFRFSFQFAKRIGWFTGRFGIKESTGGLGLDLHLLKDRFELRQDLFGFGEELYPRWRVALAYEFIRKLWLLGGVDDIVNSGRRDYFIGLQLRYDDTDLKRLLPFAAGAIPR